MSTLDSLLQSIRQQLPEEKIDYPNIPTFEVAGKNLLNSFQENLLKAGGTFYKINSIEEGQEIIKNNFPDAKVTCSATDEWEGSKPITSATIPHDMEDVDIAIVRAHLGVAEMGMVWLTENDFKINSLGFLCQNIVVLLDPDMITENMHTAYRIVNLDENPYGVFVMGPSATADIGAVLVRGAQGPRTLTILFLQQTPIQ